MASNPKADVKNKNIGTDGTNKIYDKDQGLKGKHLNQTYIDKKKEK